jgi:AraC-like DNA-binding protein
MASNLHFLTNALFTVVCIVMGTSFLSFPIPKKEGLSSYRISLKVLAITYFTLGLLTIAVLAFNLADNSREYFTFISVFISSTQALLFTFTLITLINPTFVKLNNVLAHLLPYIFFSLLYSVSVSLYGDPKLTSISLVWVHISNPTIWVRLLFLGYYFFQLIYYTYLFLREVRQYNKEILDYFSEVFQLKLKWVQIAFFSALAVGITAMISNFLPMQYDWIVILFYSLFYFGFAQEYIKYNKAFNIIEPAISTNSQDNSTPQVIRTKTDWQLYKQQIEANRFYCQTGINIEELAQKLQIGRTTLSNLINREEGVNFNTWINMLRIKEAKHLLKNNPEYSLVTISEMVGFTEQSNFSRQFKQITGETPLVWRKTYNSVEV